MPSAIILELNERFTRPAGATAALVADMSDIEDHDLDEADLDWETEHYVMMHLLAWRIASRSRQGCRSKLFY